MEPKNITKPILKWVGGKTQILTDVLNKFPTEINNYHEPFIGGSSILLGLLQYRNNNLINITGSINAYDLNKELIYLYKNIKSEHKLLYDETKLLIDDYNNIDILRLENDTSNKNNKYQTEKELAILSKERYYYYIRNLYNKFNKNIKKNDIATSAKFIFLNKTCFRGLYRTGPNGFNVPFGNYKNPKILELEHLEIIHNLIQDVNFYHMDFVDSITNIQDGDFVYLDPPYVPEDKNSFVKYTTGGFNLENHKQLFNIIQDLTTNEKKIMMSNSSEPLLYEYFDNENYDIYHILCKRRINSKNPDAKTEELIIMNY